MIKQFLAALAASLLIFTTNTSGLTENEFSEVFYLSPEQSLLVDEILQKMTLREKCAQMVIPYAVSKDTSLTARENVRLNTLVEKYGVGGFLFMRGNIENQSVILNRLQKKSKYPLLISADFERGPGMRLEDGVEFPSNMAVAAANDFSLSFLMGKFTGSEGRAMGVHQNYSPIVDVNSDYKNPIINIRAYSDNPELVARHAIAYVNGLQSAGMIATAKHFPGHGSTVNDSHAELPLITLNQNDFYRSDIVPFRSLINFGVKSVMVGHLEVPAYEQESGLPSSLSENVIDKLLKKELGFNGLIVTDALNMHSITENFKVKEIVVNAVSAGNDVLLFPANDEEFIKSFWEAAEDGTISTQRINDSVRKIIAAKLWLGIMDNAIIDKTEMYEQLHKAEHYRLAEELAEKSVTLLRDDNQVIPVNPDEIYETAVISMVDMKRMPNDPLPFAEYVKEEFGYLTDVILHQRSRKKDYNKALANAKKANLIIVPIYNNPKSFSNELELEEKQADFVKELVKLKKPMIVVSLGSPYLIKQISNVSCFLTTYGSADISEIAAVDAILGRNDIQGYLPVSIEGTPYIIGDGIKKEANGLYFPQVDADTNYNFAPVDSIMLSGVNDHVFPGGVLLVVKRDKVIYHKPFGNYTYEEDSIPVTKETIYDLASVTKVAGTTMAAMLLYDQGLLNTNTPVKEYFPEFDTEDKSHVTIENLLTHTSGLPAFKPFYKENLTREEVINRILNMELNYEPGTKYVYSDLGMVVLQQVIEKITGQPLNQYLYENLYNRVEAENIFYNPGNAKKYFCAPTEEDDYWRNKTVKGEVHDELASLMNGVSGNAGLFATAADLAKVIYVLLNDGKYGNQHIFSKKTVEYFTIKAYSISSRALGWDTNAERSGSAGEKMDSKAFGHTGFTGTSVWVDKSRELMVVLLTNRVNPSRENRKIIKFRPQLHNKIIEQTDYIN